MSKQNQILVLLLMPMTAVSAYFLGISFSIPKLNSFVFVIAFISFVFLSRLCSSLKLKWYFDSMLMVGWIFTILFGIYLVLDLLDHRNPDLQNFNETQFCTQSSYGFVGTDGGTELCAYRRFGIFDIKIGCHRSSDMYQSPENIMDIQTICKDKKVIQI